MYRISENLVLEVFDLETNAEVPVEGKVLEDALAYIATFKHHHPIAQHLSADQTLVYDFSVK